MKKTNLIFAVLSCVLLSACASGVKFAELDKDSVQIQPGKSQIVVYRTEIFGAAFQPTVYIDGVPAGKCAPKGVFVVDVSAGKYDISATTETESRIQVQAPDNGRVYVKCSITFGVLAGRPKFDMVNANIGKAESNELSFTGRY